MDIVLMLFPFIYFLNGLNDLKNKFEQILDCIIKYKHLGYTSHLENKINKYNMQK